MKQQREFIDYLKDIREMIEKIDDFIEGMEFDQFIEDDKTRFAVIRALEIIGEATKKVPQSLKKNQPKIPWREMTGIRDKLIHAYFDISSIIIWKTIKEDLPGLKRQIAFLIQEINKDGYAQSNSDLNYE